MNYLGIDPGTTQTGYCVVDENGRIREAGKVKNNEMIEMLKNRPWPRSLMVCVETITPRFGKIGESVLGTCFFIGRLMQVLEDSKLDYRLITKKEWSVWLCDDAKVDKAGVRYTLLQKYGSDKKGGPLEALKGDTDRRSAFAIAKYVESLMVVVNGRGE